VQRHGIGRQVQRTSSGSTPHEPVTIPQISSARSPAFDRPRQSTLRYPALVSNRPTVHHVRRDPPPIHQPLHRQPTCRGGSIPITNLSRGSQIAIAPAARPSFPQARFPPLEAFGRRPRARRPTVMGPASETLHNRRHRACISYDEESATKMAISKCPGQCRGFEDFDFSVVD
jgi:hypothetical protein